MAMFSRGSGGHRFSELLRAARGKGALVARDTHEKGASPEKGGTGPHGRGGEGPARRPMREKRTLPAHMQGKPVHGGAARAGHPAHTRSGAGSSGQSAMHTGISRNANFGNPPGHKTFDGNPHFADSGSEESTHTPRPEPVRLAHHGNPPGHMRKPMTDRIPKDRSGAKHPSFIHGYPNMPGRGGKRASARRGGRARRIDLASHL
jgi:hypothetical protein